MTLRIIIQIWRSMTPNDQRDFAFDFLKERIALIEANDLEVIDAECYERTNQALAPALRKQQARMAARERAVSL